MGRMYGNQGEKVIAVCVAGIDEYAQTTYIDAVCGLAQKYGYKILFFTSFSGTCMVEKYYEGEMAVYSLVNYELLDGMVVLAETIKDEKVLASMVKSAKLSGVPVVTIDHPMDGCYNIIFNYRTAMKELVRHMVEEHGYQRIEFIGGIPGNPASEERRKIFLDVMEENGRTVLPSQLHDGYFWMGPAGEAMDGICARPKEEMPDAVICANDSMAIAACRKLEKAGYRVPEDVAVTGFDGIREAMDYMPGMTTACINAASVVECAFQTLANLFGGETVPHEIVLDYKVVYGGSCGCKNGGGTQGQNSLVQSLYHDINSDHYFINQLMNMTAELSECRSIREAAGRMPEHFGMLSVWKCWICIVDNYIGKTGLLQDNRDGKPTDGKGYTEWLECVLYQDGGEYQHGIRFRQKELLPRLPQELDICGQIVIAPLHVLDRTIGYFAFTYHPDQNEFHRMQSFGNSFSSLLETLKYKTEQRLLVEKLEMQSLHDPLTGILNRRGFFRQLNKMYSESVQEGTPVAVISVDMDNLKYINDTFGHGEGDEALVCIANALTKACGRKMFCSRIGGDEFMVAGNVPEEVAAQFGRKLKVFLDEQNEKDKKEYQIGFSFGLMHGAATEETAVEEFIRQADSRMYEQKEEHHRQNGYSR